MSDSSASHPVFARGSTALITGAASGVGLAIAKLCKSHGMNVYLVDRNENLLSKAKADLAGVAGNGAVETANVDVSNLQDVESLKQNATKSFGSIELLVLNAGIGGQGTWGDNEYFSKVSMWYLYRRHRRSGSDRSGRRADHYAL